MRRITCIAAALGALSWSVTPASSTSTVVHLDPGSGSVITSSNVTYVGTIPIDSPGIGARVVKVGNQTRFYITGAKGLTIWDITNPAVPVPLGAFPLAHFQNEDVDVSDDGSRVIISSDTAHAGTDGRAGGGSMRVIDTSNPASPKQVAFLAAGNHTATCADPACEFIYGSSGGIYTFDPATNALVDTGKRWGAGGHALNRDAGGILISDSNPRLVLDVTNPLTPKTLATGKVAAAFTPDGLLQHNNVRPAGDQWVPRDPLAPDYNDPTMRPGELLIGNSESNLRTTCGNNAGGLSSWSMVNFNKGVALKQLKMFRPVNGNWANGNPAANALGCSGHWFTVRKFADNPNYFITAAWYEHGIRFITVDPATGEFKQVGFFQPVATAAGAAHWVTDEYIYTADYARGIDILKFDYKMPPPSEETIAQSWMAKLGTVSSHAQHERWLCHIGAKQAEGDMGRDPRVAL